VVTVPFSQPICNTRPLTGTDWLVVLGLASVSIVTEEFIKLYLRLSVAGKIDTVEV
jgi:hypothetical protein